MFRIEFLPSAARALGKLPPAARRRIASRIDQLAADPRGGDAVKLRATDDIWRTRVGDHRLLCRIEDDRLVVLVVKVGHRRDVYR